MKHLVLTQFGTPSESVALHDDGDPVPGPGDVLVRMEAAAVNPSDLLLLRGVYLARPEPPAPVGGEGVGIVVDAGAQADQGLLGKRVIVLPTYTYGTWAEKVVVPQDKVVEVAPDADPLQLAMLSINPATAHVMASSSYLRMLWLSRCEWTVWRNVVTDCVFHAAAAAVISSQTAKRLVISVRHWGALIR